MIHGIQTLLVANLFHHPQPDLEPVSLTRSRWRPGDWVSYVTYPDSLGIIVSPEIIDGKWIKVLWCGKTGDFQVSPGRVGRFRTDMGV